MRSPQLVHAPLLPSRLQTAYEATQAARNALAPARTLAINVDLTATVCTVLGALSRLRELRPTFVDELPRFALSHLDDLEPLALAAMHAQLRCQAYCIPSDELVAIAAEATSLRDLLHTDLITAAAHGLVDLKRLAHFRQRNGYQAVAFDLIGLTQLHREAHQQLSGKIASGSGDIERGEQLADLIIAWIALRRRACESRVPLREERDRAFTLLVRAWAQVRRAVLYLRHDMRDADTLAPSLYRGRGNSNHRRAPARDAA